MTRPRERAPLRIRPSFSPRLALFLLASHGAALAAALALPVGWHWRTALAAAILTGLGYSGAGTLFFRLPWAVREVHWHPEGHWTLRLVSGRELEATLLPSTFVSPFLTLLNFRTGHGRVRSLALPSDALNPDLARRLRVNLRLEGASGSSRDEEGLPGNRP